MCGIVGYWTSDKTPDRQVIQKMAKTIKYRGPDDGGVWCDDIQGVVFAHRRLAVIDLSPNGHQPMTSHTGRYIITYNGEIYNFSDLRKQLDEQGLNLSWRGHSDTEVLLAAIECWGLDHALEKLDGMFAFALWDRLKNQLSLARDRIGEKPLYYGKVGNTLLFGSEIVSFRCFPGFSGEIDRGSLSLYSRYKYVPAPYSIYKGIYKLPPAHYVTFDCQQDVDKPPSCYWDFPKYATTGTEMGHNASVAEDKLDQILHRSVSTRMLADVPVGAFLSGGYDSSLIAAIMQRQSAAPVNTFTIGFEEETFNEAVHAKKIAQHIGSNHTELYVSPSVARDVVPHLSTIWNEPFSDSSQIPTYIVCKLARRKVTVSLSGDGGDELFYGYSRYQMAAKLWGVLKHIPGPAKKSLATAIEKAPTELLERLQKVLPQQYKTEHLADRLHTLAATLNHSTSISFYQSFMEQKMMGDNLVLDAKEHSTFFNQTTFNWSDISFDKAMMLVDLMTYLPDDLLTKVDRASMAVGLESRLPLLSRELIEFAALLPMSLKKHDMQPKWLLRQVLYRYVPRELVDRPKMGFGVPLEFWLRGPLREWGESLLETNALKDQGFFDVSRVRSMWDEHQTGTRCWHGQLWGVLMFQSWMETQRNSTVEPYL